ncbi:signal peptidase I [Candidatus Berkelbacteria bacterium]|nr:signal peptidase I [Candidatus Berkelbacteria bacterium]
MLGKFFNWLFLLKVVIILAVIAVIIIVSIGVILPVSGKSMEPNFKSGQIVLVEKVSRLKNKPLKYGDIVAAKFPADPDKTRLIKRVLGLPGDRIYAVKGVIFRNGETITENYSPILGDPGYSELTEITLKEDEYFLVGDNRSGSSDSRLWGPVQKSDIQGRVILILIPLKIVSI